MRAKLRTHVWLVVGTALLAGQQGLAARTHAQAAASSVSPAFEAASIKRNRSGDVRRSFRIEPGGRLNATNVTVSHLMWNAFNLQDFQIIGGPEWLRSERYDISAVAGSDARPESLRLMMRSLLVDRFKLKVRPATQVMPIYALVALARGATRSGIRPAQIPCGGRGAQPSAAEAPGAVRGGSTACGFSVGTGILSGRGVTLARLAAELTGLLSRVVVDRTALSGEFDVDLEWAPDVQSDAPGDAAGAANPGPSLFTAVKEQLGLALEAQQGPVDVIVIESAQRPTEN